MPFPLNLLGEIFYLCFQVTINIIVGLINLLGAAHIPGAMGFAIIIISILIRFIVWPFMSTQLKASKKMSELKPQLDELKNKHKGDKQALALAQSALYKQHGINPAAGCLPALIQIPIVYSLYQSVQLIVGGGTSALAKINSMLLSPSLHLKSLPDTHFFGLNLASKPSEFSSIGLLILLVPVITALLQFIQGSMMVAKTEPKIKKTDSIVKKEEAEDATAAVQSQMRYMMPLMIGYFAFSFPIGLAIYWNTFTLLGIFQQYRLGGWGSAEDLFKKLKR